MTASDEGRMLGARINAVYLVLIAIAGIDLSADDDEAPLIADELKKIAVWLRARADFASTCRPLPRKGGGR